jgi:hypothetical protein
MRDENAVVRSIAMSRKNLFELAFTVILLALGLNLISSQLFSWLEEKSLVLLIIGTLLCFVPIIYLLRGFFSERVKRAAFTASIAYNPIKRNLISIRRYDFSEKISDYIEAAFVENSALKTRWEKQPLEPYTYTIHRTDGAKEKADFEVLSKMRFPFDGNLETILPPNAPDGEFSMNFGPLTAKENATIDLLCQAAEYFLLEKLSSHLFGYFNDDRFSWEQLTNYERNDIPSVLLSNTFLELFSRPMPERPAFVEHANEDIDGRINYMDGGSMYQKFRMVLPKGSTVKRPREHEIEIETKKLKICLAAYFPGGLEHISFEFLLYYLGCTNLLEVAMYRANIEISISVKPWAMFSTTGWEYYHWVDSFLDEIEQSASQSSFLSRINWESTLTSIDCARNIMHLMQDGHGDGKKVPHESKQTTNDGAIVHN